MRYTLITPNKKRLGFSIPWVIFFGSIFIGCNRCKLSPCVDSHEQLIFSPTPTNISNPNPTNISDTNPTNISDTNPTNIPDTNPTNIPDTNPTNIPDTNPTNIPDTNTTNIPDTNTTNIPDTNPTNIPDTNPTNIPDTNSTSIPNTNPNNIPATNNGSTPPMENQDITQEMIDRIQNQAARGPVGLRNLANVLRELKRGDKTNLNTPDPAYVYTGTALHSAALIGDLEIVKILLQAGANINAKNERSGTPLCSAIIGSHVDIAAYLLSEGADKTITSGANRGDITPYELAKEYYKIGPTNQKAKRLVDMLKP